MKNNGILIFTNEEILEHKKSDGKFSEGNECFWTMSKFPIKEFNRFYIAVKGIVRGYFEVNKEDIHPENNEFVFDSDSWKDIENGEHLKPSQGFRYYVHDN